MKVQHVIALAVVLVLGYYLGIKYPATGQAALAKVGM